MAFTEKPSIYYTVELQHILCFCVLFLILKFWKLVF